MRGRKETKRKGLAVGGLLFEVIRAKAYATHVEGKDAANFARNVEAGRWDTGEEWKIPMDSGLQYTIFRKRMKQYNYDI